MARGVSPDTVGAEFRLLLIAVLQNLMAFRNEESPFMSPRYRENYHNDKLTFNQHENVHHYEGAQSLHLTDDEVEQVQRLLLPDCLGIYHPS